ncbi:MAG: hypothetical protein JWM47_3858 [Acidimicrobiales bacterium]|nr:hypothetical protein [Acidimicrobiales bacterium]
MSLPRGSPPRRRAGRALLGVLVALAATGAGWVWWSSSWSSSSSSSSSSGLGRSTHPSAAPDTGLKPADPTPSTATPTRHTGPQGRVGQFVVACGYSHSGAHDPIVHPGHEGRSHRHDFYGSPVTESTSTIDDLLAGKTTCDKTVDTAAYWQPTLYDHDDVVVPTEVHAYYRAAPGIDPATVQTMPLGLALIAGDATATGAQAGEATGWTCGSSTTLADVVPECSPGAPLHLVLTFQDCWDGRYLDSVDHRSHVTYSTRGACPDSHPVSIPQVSVSISFPIAGRGHDLRLASGSIYSAHGDFWNAWDPDGLEREIAACIRRRAVCDLASNRGEEPLFGGGG